jgi:hypothetical protein
MSESHELYKEYKKAQEKRMNSERRGSSYTADYRKDEEIARLKYQLKDKEEKEENDRAYKFLSDNEY